MRGKTERISDLYSQSKLSLLFFRYRKRSKPWSFAKASHAHHSIDFIVSGSSYVRTDSGTTELTAGRAYLIPKGIFLEVGNTDPVEKFYTYFRWTLCTGIDFLADLTEPVDLGPFDLGESVASIRERIERWSFRDYQACQLITKKQILNVDIAFEDILAAQGRHFNRYTKLYNHLENELTARTRLQDLADIQHMSPPSLSRAFKRDTGRSLKEHMLKMLNDKACLLLMNTDMKVYEVAHSLGYEDEHYFARSFARMNHVSPTAYRRSLSSDGD